MKQTLLAFLAMSMFSLLALSQQRVALKYHGMVHGRDVEMAAMDLMMSWFGNMQTRAFDEADVSLASSGTPRTNTIGLTPASSLGPEDSEAPSLFDDLDDYHGLDTLRMPYVFNQEVYAFDVNVDVRYVNPLNPSSPLVGASLAKEVTISLLESDEPIDRSRVKVEIKRIFSPAELKYH